MHTTNDWVDIESARTLRGLRIALVRGFPSPWSVAARWIFELKGIPFVKVERTAEDKAHDRLRAWTGQDSLPAVMLDEERPRTHWHSILVLAERLAPEPRLIPNDPRDRALANGFATELLGELGLVWNVRLLGVERRAASTPDDPGVIDFLAKYRSGRNDAAAAPARIREILDLFAARMRAQLDSGREHLVGDSLTALDIYFASVTALIRPTAALGLSEQALALAQGASERAGSIDPILMELRDRIFARHYGLPLRLD